MAKKKKEKHAHWKSLIKKLEEVPVKEVQMILIKRIGRRKKKGTNIYYDRKAYVIGTGSDYIGEFLHQQTCTWDPEN